jgi:putative ABC transport system permease protein
MTHKMEEPQPPRFSKWLIKRIFKDELEVKLGDFIEIYSTYMEDKNGLQARMRFWMYLLRSIPAYFKDSLCMGGTMFKNYLKIAFRNFYKHKSYSVINILGLAIGSACCILILMYMTDELSFDNYHEKGDRIYKVLSFSTMGTTTRQYASIPPAISPELVDSIPEVESSVRIYGPFELRAQNKNRDVELSELYWADPTFFKIFSHEFIQGNPETVFNNPDSIVISESLARRIFGTEDPLGKLISFEQFGSRALQITGLIRDVPRNSHFRFQAISPFQGIEHLTGNSFPLLADAFYSRNRLFTYLLLREDADMQAVEHKIGETAEAKWGELYKQKGTERSYPLQKLKDIHLKSKWEGEIAEQGNITSVILFSGIAIFVLLIACFNFINLSTARSSIRAKEVGMRKVLGSFKGQLIRQFLFESIFLALFSLILGILFVSISLPAFNRLSGKEFDSSFLFNLPILAGFLGIMIISGFFAGSFPAFVLSAFKPVQVLKGQLGSTSKKSTFRKILVTVQFSISIFMIIGVITIIKQLNYIKNTSLGFNKEQMLIVPFFGRTENESDQRYEDLKERLKQNPGIVSVSFSTTVPGTFPGYEGFLPEGRSEEEIVRAATFTVGYDFITTYGIELLEGRDFSKEFSTGADQVVLLNEKAARMFGWEKDALGKNVISIRDNNIKLKIIGIVKDFHYSSLKLEITPVILRLDTSTFYQISARLRPENVQTTIAFIEETLKEMEQGWESNYYFIDDRFKAMYPEENKVQEIFLAFGALAVFVACLGLLGLSFFTTEQRTKEIGVRKILGASVREIVLLLSGELTKWILAANILAWPLAYFIMRNWLRNFAYRIDMGVDIFILSGSMALIIALLTISLQTIKVAMSNPVHSLRHE